MAEKNYLDDNGLLYFWTKLKSLFVQKDGNKVLSDENYTTPEKEKLAGLNNYTLPTASADTLGGVKVGAGLAMNDGVLSATGGGTADSVDWSNVQNKPNTVAGYGITDANVSGQTVTIGTNSVTVPTNTNELTNGAGFVTQSYVDSKVSSVYKYKGSVANRESLPSNAEIGDTYNLEDTGANVAWDGTKWDDLGMTIDLSGYVQETDLVAITNGEIDDILAS